MTKEELKIFVFASIISADNDEFTEEQKQEVISRNDERPGDWEYIFENLPKKEKLIKLFTEDE